MANGVRKGSTAEGQDNRRGDRSGGSSEKPMLEYVAGVVGLLLTLGLLGFIGREAFAESSPEPVFVAVHRTGTHAVHGGYEVEFEARNVSGKAASGVQIEATLEIPGAKPIASQVTLDYVPGHSVRKGGVFFPVDPQAGKLELRAHGYAEP
jgi:uncharacterized protein (TIGR02588 family)